MATLRQLEQRINALLDQRDTSHDVESIQDICAIISRSQFAKEALEVLKEPIKRGKPPMQLRALHILALLVQFGDQHLHMALATRRWMERLLKVAKTKDEMVRDAVAQNIVNWNARFHAEVAFIEFNVALKRLEQKGCPLPQPSEPVSPPGTTHPPAGFPRAGSGIYGSGGLHSGSADSTLQRDAGTPGAGQPPSQVETMIQNIQRDLRVLEAGLQEPGLLQGNVIENCKRWQRKIELMLSTDLTDNNTFQLIALQDQVGEYLELYRAISSEEARAALSSSGGGGLDDSQERKAGPALVLDAQRGGSGPPSPPAAHSPPRERAPEPPQSPTEPVDSAELEALQARLAQARDARKAVEEECDAVRRQINAAKAQQGMSAAVSDSSPAGLSNLNAIARATVINARRVVKQGRALQGAFEPVRSAKQKTSAYVRNFEPDLEQAAAQADRGAKAEAKGFENLKKIYMSEMQLRKKLFAQIQEFRGNTRIYCRVRPLSAEERALGEDGEDITGFPGASEIILKEAGKPRMFEVDGAFKPADKTKALFDDLAGMVECAVDGFNVVFVAYGQGNSGKSHTLFGTDRDPGLIQLSSECMFGLFRERAEMEASSLTISAIEVSNEAVKDAFDPRGGPLQIQQSDHIGTYVEGLSAVPVASPDDCVGRARRAQDARDRSGRTALGILLAIQATNTQSGVTTTGKLLFIDLPPSEKQDKMCVALGTIMDRIQQNAKADQIPYKSSRLTHAFQDFFGGPAKQMFICTLSPSKACIQESAATLAFAFKVRGVILGGGKK